MNNTELLERKEKRTEYMADYYQSHKAEKKAYAQGYYQENKETIKKRNKEWYEKHKNAPSKKLYYRQKDILRVLSSQRKNIGETSYCLLITEIKKLEKSEFRS